MADTLRTSVFFDRDHLLGMTPDPAAQGDGVERLVEMVLHGLPEDRLRVENIIQVIVQVREKIFQDCQNDHEARERLEKARAAVRRLRN